MRFLVAPTRRGFLLGTASLPLATPMIWTRRAAAAQQLVVRTPGGVFDEVKKKTVYDPFREATGIEIVPVASTAAKLLAMFKAGQVDIDVIDTGDDCHYCSLSAPARWSRFRTRISLTPIRTISMRVCA